MRYKMIINFSPVNLCNKINQTNLKRQNAKYPKFKPLAYDTISFGAMKKAVLDEEIEKVKKDLSEAIKNNDTKKIYGYFGIDTEEDEDGYLTISRYEQPSEDYTFKDLGIDENKLLEKVKTITGNADFVFSQVTNLSNLETIYGDAYFMNSQVTNLSNLKTITGSADFSNSQVSDLSSLKTVGGDAYFGNSKVTDLNSLETVGGDAYFGNLNVNNIKSLKSVKGCIFMRTFVLTMEIFEKIRAGEMYL